MDNNEFQNDKKNHFDYNPRKNRLAMLISILIVVFVVGFIYYSNANVSAPVVTNTTTDTITQPAAHTTLNHAAKE